MDISFQHCPLYIRLGLNVSQYPSNEHRESWIRSSLCIRRREQREKSCKPRELIFTHCYYRSGQTLTTPLLPTHPHEMKDEHFFKFTCILVLELAQLPRDCTPGRCSYTAETQRPVGRMNSPFSVQSRQCAQAALGSPLGQHRRS